MNEVKNKGAVCTKRSCVYTKEQRVNAANQSEEFSEIICNLCQKKKWACSRCARKSGGTFAFVSRQLHLKNPYFHSTVKRPSGIRTAKEVTKMKRPVVYRRTSKEKFVSDGLLHVIYGHFPFGALTTLNVELQAGDQPSKLSMDNIKHRLPKNVSECLEEFFSTSVLRYSTENDKPFSLWNNNSENSYTPLHTNKFSTLLVVVGGLGHRKVFIAKNPGDAKQIQDGIGIIWKRGEDDGDSVVWNPQKTKESWYEVMLKNANTNAVVCFTLTVGDALIVPRGLLHGVFAYGTTTMLSVPLA